MSTLKAVVLLFVFVVSVTFGNASGQAQAQSIALSVNPAGLVAVGTRLDINSCWKGFSQDQLSNLFLAGSSPIQFTTNGESWVGLPTLPSGVLGNDCYRSTYVVPVSWSGVTIGLRAIYKPTGQTSNIVGLAITVIAQTRFVIQVTVLDQNGNDYDGVTGTLWQGTTLLDSGETKGGIWSTMPIPGGGRRYDVQVYNGQTYSRAVTVDASNVAVTFELARKSPSPMLILSKVSTMPERVMVGSAFKWILQISNMGALPALDASLILNVSYPFVMAGSGTTIYIGILAPNDIAPLTANVGVDLAARSGVYSIPYFLRYSDSKNYSYTDLGTFGITIYGVPRLEISSISVDPANLSPGTSGFLTVTLMNTGTDRAINTQLSVFNGNDILTSTLSYIGKIDPGKSTTVTFGVQVQDSAAVGLRTLTILTAYSDPYGLNYTRSQVYNTYVYPPQPLIPTYAIVAIVVVMLAVVFGYVALRRLGYKTG